MEKNPSRNFKYFTSNLGFTLIELMVVVSIMVILTTVFVLNLAGQRQARDIKLAQTQLVSNLRKAQSYTLSARSLSGGQAVQYYVMKFDLTKPGQYTLQAISNVSASPQLRDVETMYLPPNIQVAISIARPLNPTSQSIQSSPACALASFAAPFGKIIFNDGCLLTNLPALPTLQSTDDYYAKIINFQTNVACGGSYGVPAICTASTDSVMTITLTARDNSVPARTVTINGITGAISFN